MTEVERLRKALRFYACSNFNGDTARKALAAEPVPTPPESRDTPPRHKDREKAWEAFKVQRYGSTKEVGIVPGVRIAFDFAWDAAR